MSGFPNLLKKKWAERVHKNSQNRARNWKGRKSQGEVVEHTLTPEEIMDLIPEDGKCPATGMKLTFVWLTPGDNTHYATLDRRNPALGYTKDNVRVFSAFANRAKGQLDDEKLVMLCKLVAERF